MMQWIIVAGLVIASAIYAAWSLLPARSRLKLLDAIAGNAAPSSWLSKLRSKTVAELAGGCGSCGSNADAVHRAAPPRRKQS